jgi:16S rRNA (adenine1518-N6/adenine1519-N6)-dimethyltransferase
VEPSLLDAPEVLKKYGILPKKSLGQNFIINQRVLDDVISAADLTGHEEIIEIGAGFGTLTIELAQHAGRVFAVEIDKRLIPVLRDNLQDFENVTLLHASMPPARVVLTIQREVAQRIISSPGDMSLLALSVQIYGHAVITARFPAECFYPVPEVDSAVLRIDIYDEPVVPREVIPAIFSLARAGFSQKRKKLRNSLARELGSSPEEVEKLLAKAGIQPKSRAQELSIQDWQKIARIAAE